MKARGLCLVGTDPAAGGSGASRAGGGSAQLGRSGGCSDWQGYLAGTGSGATVIATVPATTVAGPGLAATLHVGAALGLQGRFDALAH